MAHVPLPSVFPPSFHRHGKRRATTFAAASVATQIDVRTDVAESVHDVRAAGVSGHDNHEIRGRHAHGHGLAYRIDEPIHGYAHIEHPVERCPGPGVFGDRDEPGPIGEGQEPLGDRERCRVETDVEHHDVHVARRHAVEDPSADAAERTA